MITQRVSLTAQDARKVSTTKLHRLGSVVETADGRVYRYAKAGATPLAVGNLQVNPDLVANHTNRTIAAAVPVGSHEFTATLGATAATLDQYEDGYATINDAAGEGIQYSVVGNSAAASAGVITVKLADDEPVQVALTTASEVTLKQNNWANTVISAVNQAALPVGVPNTAVAAGSFYWAQTGGECSVLADASVHARGLELTISAATAGAVGIKDAAGEARVGIASELLVSTEYRAAFLTIN